MSEMKRELIELLRTHSYKQAPPGQPFTLASGAKSDYFIDVKMTALLARGHEVLGELLSIELGWYASVSAVAGVELGGCPLASAVASKGIYDAVYVRKAAKDHGTAKLVEGAVRPNMGVVLLEDVFTTGGSTLRAVQTLKDAGCLVLGVIGVVDREQGAAVAFKEAKLHFQALVNISELRG